jgi:hypothetical protein
MKTAWKKHPNKCSSATNFFTKLTKFFQIHSYQLLIEPSLIQEVKMPFCGFG